MRRQTKSLKAPGLDTTFAGIGALFAASIMVYGALAAGKLLYFAVGTLTLGCCLTWLYLRKGPLAVAPQGLRDSRSRRLALATAFFILLTASTISIYTPRDPYVRPPIYFVLTALMVSLIFVDIMLDSSSRVLRGTILTQIVVVGLSLVITQSLAFPSIVGVDPWWHRWFVNRILGSGHIPPNYAYSVFPIFHLEITATMLSTGLDYKLATIGSISFLLIALDSILVWLIGRLLFTERIGLLAALLSTIASF